MLAEAARCAVEVAIATATVSAVCIPVSESYQIEIAECGIGAMITQSEGTNGQKVRINHSDARSLIVWPEDLKVGKFCYRPQHGDKWKIKLPSGKVIEAECAPMPPEIHWRWTDRFQTAFRIHVKIFDD